LPTNCVMPDRVIIADSSPLIALAIADSLKLLPLLYTRILLPPAVWHEVTVAGADMPGADIVHQTEWLEVVKPYSPTVVPLSILVDKGEAEAIALAQNLPDASLLLDDAQARRLAQRLGLPHIGTLGIMRRAKRAGLIEQVAPLIERLERHGIYVGAKLVDAILRDVGERH